jgi:hypothetical protein
MPLRPLAPYEFAREQRDTLSAALGEFRQELAATASRPTCAVIVHVDGAYLLRRQAQP